MILRALALATTLALAAAFAPSPAVATTTPSIAVIDSGIDPNHPEFAAGQVAAWRDFVSDRAHPYDDHGHGTAVASRAAGRTLGAFPGAPLLIAKVLDAQNRLGSWGPLGDAIRWATDQGAAVINVSIWGTLPQPTSARFVAGAIAYANQNGSVVVWIAGNGGELASPVPSPITATVLVGSSSPQALVVGASTASGRPADFSQRDPEVLAHGANVSVAWRGGFYTTGSGTSYAAPWIAGVVARLVADGAPRDVEWLEWVVLHSARDTDAPYLDEGYGVFDDGALAAARAVARGDAPVPPLDERDLLHIATTVPRVAQTAQPPSAVLPP